RFIVFYHMSRQKPHATLFAYTTLFRSGPAQRRLPDRLPSMVGECSRCSGSRRLERRTGRILLEQQVQRLQDLHLRLEHDENAARSEEHTSELQSRENLGCRLLLGKKNK